LDHDLLGGLGGDAAEDVQRQRRALARGREVAARAVEFDDEFARVLGVELLAQRGRDRLFYVRINLVALDVLVPGDPVHDSQ
jgi:hypothetical protein